MLHAWMRVGIFSLACTIIGSKIINIFPRNYRFKYTRFLEKDLECICGICESIASCESSAVP